MGDAGLIGAVYFATFLISNVVTNNAAAALIFPIAMEAAEQANVDIILMAYTVMLGASASFMTPFGYTTNLLIYGPGGYMTKDFVYFGTPMQLFLWVLSTSILTIRPWYVWWIATAVLLFVVAFFSVAKDSVGDFRAARNKPNQNTI
jgi:di/tricarboxylate transporter